MGHIHVSSEKQIHVPADRVYRYIADYAHHHHRFLPDTFSDFKVEEGGYGAGTVVSYNVKTGQASLVADNLNFPNGIAVGSSTVLWVSANSTCPAGGGPAEACGFMGTTSGLLLKIKL